MGEEKTPSSFKTGNNPLPNELKLELEFKISKYISIIRFLG